MKIFFNSIIILFSLSISAQTTTANFKLSTASEVSVITCGPGDAVYEAFGHSAIRIRDSKQGIDKVYNYGVFDFDTPNFYGKFAQGNLLYLLGTSSFSRFIRSYQIQNRWVKAQVLDISQAEAQAYYDFLENNALPQNRGYLYDYFFDNCSTRLYDVLEASMADKLVTPPLFNNLEKSHRELIQPYLTHQSWGDFGIDIALGSVIDRNVSMKEFLFLPENVFTFFDQLKIKENGEIKPIVKRTETILTESRVASDTFLTPFILFTIIGLVVVFRTRKDIQNQTRTRWLDFGLFFGTGLIGLVLTLIWFATNHIAAANNFNVFWAFAPNLLVSFVLLKKTLPAWIKKYVFVLLILQALVVCLWVFRIQIFSNAILPILVLSSVRYYYLVRFTKEGA